MGRLFWKFFFSYWGALLVTVLGVTTTLWVYQVAEQGRDLSLEAGPRAALVVGASATTLGHGGLGALRELLGDLSRNEDVLVLAVDEAGRDVLGRPVAPVPLAHARELAESGKEPEVVRRVITGNGVRYTLYIPAAATPWPQRMPFRGGPPSPMVPLTAGLVASLVFGALLAWYVARPIRHLRAAFASLSHGKLETRVGALMGGRRDEVADLGRDFDGMAQQLQTLYAAQRSLLHEVSHELRSPLARLQAAIGLARQSPESIEGSLDRIEQEAGRVDELVGQLLTLSRLEASVDESSRERLERTDLVDLVAAVAEDGGFEAQSSGRSVVFRGQGETVADVRAELLHRAVENVVRNAVKYTRPGTTVEVSAGPDAGGSMFLVGVADRGPGVAESELEAIFEPFYRSAGGPPGPGVGLGLAITRRAVDALGGHVRARNRTGGGLVVEISLPLGGPRTARS